MAFKNPAVVALRCTRHFEELFAEVAVDDLSGNELLDSWESPNSTRQAREALIKRFTLLELQNALPRADLDTATGPDGLPWQFYRKLWPQVGRLLFKALCHSLCCSELPRNMDRRAPHRYACSRLARYRRRPAHRR